MSREKAFLYVGGSIVAALLILLFLARPAYQDMQASKTTLNDKKQEKAEVEQELADTKQLIADFQATSDADKKAVDTHIPPHKDQAGLIAQLEVIAKASKSLISSIHFDDQTKENDKTVVSELPVTLTISGNYDQLQDFMESLEQNKRLVTVREVSYESRADTLVAKIEFTTYYQDAGKRKTSGVDTTNNNQDLL